jgi:hypothetical protein
MNLINNIFFKKKKREMSLIKRPKLKKSKNSYNNLDSIDFINKNQKLDR